MSSSSSQAELIARPLEFAGGKVAPNRLAKAPMEEMLSKAGGGPHNYSHFQLYRTWARGGWGMVITGNVAIDPTHLGTPFDVAVPLDEKSIPEFKAALRRMANAASGRDQPDIPASKRPLVIVQLVHAGRQSMRGSGRSILKPAMAPSNVPMRPTAHLGIFGRAFDHLLFGTVQEMSIEQIAWLKERFVTSSVLCAEAGFDGVELHGSHGYMLAAFLSPKTNTRTDKYGGSPENRCRIVLEIADEVRKRVPKDFLVGVKLNSSDYVQGGLTEEEALLNVKWLAENGGIDFVEISGGNYENPSFVMEGFDPEKENAKLAGKPIAATGQDPHAKVSSRTKKREAFFQTFARECRSVLPEKARLKLILTGGLRTRSGIAQALSETGGAVDMACLGRPAAVFPDLPLRLTDTSIPDDNPRADTPDYKVPALSSLGAVPIKLVGAGWGTLWHSLMIVQIATGVRVPSPRTSILTLFRSLSGAPTSQDGKAAAGTAGLFVKLSVILIAVLAVSQRFFF